MERVWRESRDERVVRTVANYLNLCANCTLIAPALTRCGKWPVLSCVARGTWPTGGNHLNCFNFFKPRSNRSANCISGQIKFLGKQLSPFPSFSLSLSACPSLYFPDRGSNKSWATIKPHATHALIYSHTHTYTHTDA